MNINYKWHSSGFPLPVFILHSLNQNCTSYIVVTRASDLQTTTTETNKRKQQKLIVMYGISESEIAGGVQVSEATVMTLSNGNDFWLDLLGGPRNWDSRPHDISRQSFSERGEGTPTTIYATS